MKKHLIILSILSLLLCFSTTALADLVLADGEATGQWFNPERSGEGFYIEIINTGGSQQIGVAMFTFDDSGAPLWVSGNVAIGPNDEVVAIPVFQFDGPAWGPGFDSDDLNITPFGTITVRFPTCDTALFSVVTEGDLQNGNYSLVRLTDIEGIECNDPPSEPQVRPGTWRGTGLCFNVSADGRSLTEAGSACDGNAAFDSRLEDGISDEGVGCNVDAECDGIWQIEGGKFACTGELGTLAVGTFGSATSASGLAFEPEGGVGDICAAAWSATPE